ncbi:hypothetical protein [Pedobacter sp. L105]|uniref:hypothetical protein n=1 Tax=Pedobacter sp. L105 TaxID=1641871 RepID=UPI00131EB997|nr:hypothetical protein [Pedobacter sp. L105]
MKVHRKNLPLYLFIAISITTACKKDKTPVQKTSVAIPPNIPVPEKAYIPTQLESGKSKMVFSYTSNLSLSKIDYTGGDSVVLNYTADGKPLNFLRYKNKKLIYSSEYSLDQTGIVISAAQFTLEDENSYAIGSYNLIYNTASQLTAISYYSTKDQLLNEQQKTYTTSGNLLSDDSTSPGLSLSYQYDDKNGLFKNVNYAWLFAVEKENRLLLSVINNIQQCNYTLMPDSNQTFSYAYNADKYPETIISTSNGISSTFKVTYKQVK